MILSDGSVVARFERLEGVRTSQGIYVDESRELSEDYKQAARRALLAPAETLPFRNNPAAAAEAINDHAEKATEIDDDEGRVEKKGLRPMDEDLVADAAYVLTSGMAFKSAWKSKFDKARTNESGTFTNAQGVARTVPMMQMEGMQQIASLGEDFVAVKMPFENGTSMVAVVPRMPDQWRFAEPSEYETALSERRAKLGGILSALEAAGGYEALRFHEIDGALSIPRFESKATFDPVEALRHQGFDLSRLSFPNVLTHGSPTIERSVHSATWEIDEEGGKGQAFTALVALESLVYPTEVRLDVGFAFAVVDDTTGLTLFEGVKTDFP